MLDEQLRDRVRHDRRLVDVRIEAAAAGTGMQHVPQRNTARLQPLQPLPIGKIPRKAEQLGQNRPERVARMRVILLRFEGSLSRHAAQNQDSCPR